MSEIIINEVITTVDLTVTEIITTQVIVINELVGNVPSGGTTGQILAKASDSNYDIEWVDPTGGGGVSNLALTANPTNNTVTNSNGTGFVIPLADGTNSGLLKPDKFTVLESTSGANSGDNATNTQYSGLSASKEDAANKSNSLSDVASTTKFPVWAIIVTYITNALASFKTTNFLDFTSSGQTQLNNKEPLKLRRENNSVSPTVTGTTTQTILVDLPVILAGTAPLNKPINIFSILDRTVRTNSVVVHLYVNNTLTLSGAEQLGSFTSGATNSWMPFERNITFRSGNIIEVFSPGVSAGATITDKVVSASPGVNISYNFTANDMVFFIAVTPGISTDTIFSNYFQLIEK